MIKIFNYETEFGSGLGSGFRLHNFAVLMIDQNINKLVHWSVGISFDVICTIDECGETFYDCHTAQHPAAVIRNNSKKFRSFKSKENIHKKEVWPYHGFGY